jgi:hypothetical protein
MSTQAFTTCPACGQVAEIRDRFVLSSTEGPIEHVRIMCLLRHQFALSTADLDREFTLGGGNPAERDRALGDHLRHDEARAGLPAVFDGGPPPAAAPPVVGNTC